MRHTTGYKLANDGRDTRALQHYLGQKNIMHTVESHAGALQELLGGLRRDRHASARSYGVREPQMIKIAITQKDIAAIALPERNRCDPSGQQLRRLIQRKFYILGALIRMNEIAKMVRNRAPEEVAVSPLENKHATVG